MVDEEEVVFRLCGNLHYDPMAVYKWTHSALFEDGQHFRGIVV